MKNKSTSGSMLELESVVASKIKPLYRSDRGGLYHGDCLSIVAGNGNYNGVDDTAGAVLFFRLYIQTGF